MVTFGESYENLGIASIILTKSVRKLLPKDQNAPLIAHELEHIKARDTLAANVGGMFLNATLSVALIGADGKQYTSDKKGALFCRQEGAIAAGYLQEE